jgi:hypothetical protein
VQTAFLAFIRFSVGKFRLQVSTTVALTINRAP